jgi:transcriptional regulator with XRE-family HTH domain
MPDGTLMSDLGRELKRGRVAAGYRTQQALAGPLKVDRTAVSRVENGKRIPPDAMLKEWCVLCTLDYARLEV